MQFNVNALHNQKGGKGSPMPPHVRESLFKPHTALLESSIAYPPAMKGTSIHTPNDLAEHAFQAARGYASGKFESGSLSYNGPCNANFEAKGSSFVLPALVQVISEVVAAQSEGVYHVSLEATKGEKQGAMTWSYSGDSVSKDFLETLERAAKAVEGKMSFLSVSPDKQVSLALPLEQ